jgi:methionyl aminopeptidase
MIAKSEKDVEALREAGKRMKQVVDAVLAAVEPGVSSMELERVAREATEKVEATPSYLGHKSGKNGELYPAVLCVSINNEIVHSPPKPEKFLQEGDVVLIDFGLSYRGYFMDTAYTVGVGAVDKKAENLINGTREALVAAIATARAGGFIGDIGAAVEATAKRYKLNVVKDLSGHGVGAAVHEDPLVPNYGKAGKGELLVEGMVLAIEPIFSEGSGALMDDIDAFTIITRDGSRAAHFEHTILVTKDGAEVLTA